MVNKKKKSGGKLNRSEIIQARLNPKLRFAAELMARQQRRTVSSFIEELIEEAAEKKELSMLKMGKHHLDMYEFEKKEYCQISVKEGVEHIWSSEEPDRFAAFAMCFPNLLTPDETRLWELIFHHPYFWEHYEVEDVTSKSKKVVGKSLWPIKDFRGLIREHLREHWQLLNDIVYTNLYSKEEINPILKIPYCIGKKIDKPDYYPPVRRISILYDD